MEGKCAKSHGGGREQFGRQDLLGGIYNKSLNEDVEQQHVNEDRNDKAYIMREGRE